MSRKPEFSPRIPHRLIELFSESDLKAWPEDYKKAKRFHSEFYQRTAEKRAELKDEIIASLQSASCAFEFNLWTRVVTYKYALDPLSPAGSMISDPGGRFNIGDINDKRFDRFPALYIASDLDTALKEAFGLESTESIDGLTGPQLGQIDDSFCSVKLNGNLTKICDLREIDKLKNYLKVVRKVTLPKNLFLQCEKYKMRLIQTVEELLRVLMAPNWRFLPQQFDIPSTSQIFGRQLLEAGFQGILYPSSKDGKNCLAIFTDNFTDEDISIKIAGGTPEGVKQTSLTATRPCFVSGPGSC